MSDPDREPVLWLYEYAMQPTGRRFKIGEENGRLFTYYEDGQLAGDVREECLVRSLLAKRARLEGERDALAEALRGLVSEVVSAEICPYGDAFIAARALLARLGAGGEEE